MYGYEGVFPCERGGEVVDVICMFASLGRNKYV